MPRLEVARPHRCGIPPDDRVEGSPLGPLRHDEVVVSLVFEGGQHNRELPRQAVHEDAPVPDRQALLTAGR